MIKCKNCGKELDDDVKVCPDCGASLVEESAEQKPAEQNDAEQKASEQKSPSFSEKVKNLNNTKDTTSEFDKKDVEDNKVMGVLAYLSILVLIPLFAAKDSKFARYHTNQGLVLFIAEAITLTVLGILTIIPYVGVVFGIIEGLAGLCFLILSILGIVNVANGSAKELPVVGKYQILK